MLVFAVKITRCHKPEDERLNVHRHENLKSGNNKNSCMLWHDVLNNIGGD